MTDWTVIGVKKDTHKRFKQAAKGQYHDYFVNELLTLWAAATPVERAEFIERYQRPVPFYEPDRDESGCIIESTETKARHCAELKEALANREAAGLEVANLELANRELDDQQAQGS